MTTVEPPWPGKDSEYRQWPVRDELSQHRRGWESRKLSALSAESGLPPSFPAGRLMAGHLARETARERESGAGETTPRAKLGWLVGWRREGEGMVGWLLRDVVRTRTECRVPAGCYPPNHGYRLQAVCVSWSEAC